MNGKDLMTGLSFIDQTLIEESQREGLFREAAPRSPRKSLRRPLLLAAAVLLAAALVGCAVVWASVLFGSPKEMIAGLYGENTGFTSAAPRDDYDPEKPDSQGWTVPGFEKQPVEETVAQELQKWVSPVGQSIETDGLKLTVDAYIYDSATQCGLITMLLEHDTPFSDDQLGLGRDGCLGGIHGTLLNFNQYGWPYLIPEKTTENLLAFTFYFRADLRSGTNLLVSFPDFDSQDRYEEYEKNRPGEIAATRQRLKQELTPEEVAQKLQELQYPRGYNEEYDDYYFLAAYEYDQAHLDSLTTPEDLERQSMEQQLRQELTPEEAEAKLRALWGDELVEETFADRSEEVPDFAYSELADRKYEQNHLDEMICVSLPNSGTLPSRTFGQGRICANSICLRIREKDVTASGDSIRALTLHMVDGTDFTVLNATTDNTYFKVMPDEEYVYYMLNSAINIDKIQSIEVAGDTETYTLEADQE